MFIKIPLNTRRIVKRDKNFKQSVIIYLQTSTVQIYLLRVGCILGCGGGGGGGGVTSYIWHSTDVHSE